MIRSQPSRPPTNDRMMKKIEKPAARPAPTVVPALEAASERLVLRIAARCLPLRGAVSEVARAWGFVVTLVMTATGTFAARRLDSALVRNACMPRLPAMPEPRRPTTPTSMPKIEGMRRMYPIVTTTPLMRYFFLRIMVPVSHVLHLIGSTDASSVTGLLDH